MIKEYSKLNLFQKIAIYFYENIDKTGIYYETFYNGTKNRVARIILYTLYIGSIVTLFYLIKNYFNLTDFIEDKQLIAFLSFVGQIITPLFLCYITFPFFYETLYNKVLIKEVLANKKEYKQAIKKNKKEWWRLRNIHFIFRIIIYFFISSFISTQVLVFTNISSFKALDTDNINIDGGGAMLTWALSILIIIYLEVKIRKNQKHSHK